ncbi:SidA/IucD/PvdA family monooxygenase, partial [Pseudoalteromonas sp. S4492]|uniref:SidA/IucD/PvdA family monooxygenase n=1 Tax=Pseudoalteromonas sp. S4492 TaxID=579560 RepID=UPI00110A61DE
VISRAEFVEYMSWVADNLNSLQFDSEIREVSFEDNCFILHSDKQKIKARNLCLGTGKAPYVPDCAKPLMGQHCFHASELMTRQPDLRNRKVAVIGGGQTGAEVFLNCLRDKWGKADQ